MWVLPAVVHLGLVSILVGLAFAIGGALFSMNTFPGAFVLLSGLVLVPIGVLWPARERRSAGGKELDRLIPRYQFNEVHSLAVRASREVVYQAVNEVSAQEIRFFRTLTWIRRFGSPSPEGILNAPAHEPLLAVATRTSFLRLAEQPSREMVVGTAVIAPVGWRQAHRLTPDDFLTPCEPGFALAAINFFLEGDDQGPTQLTTETRVFATDEQSTRRFAAYWRIIYPGSALIRRMWLHAIKVRAEASEVRGSGSP